jgi:hypothetical protein
MFVPNGPPNLLVFGYWEKNSWGAKDCIASTSSRRRLGAVGVDVRINRSPPHLFYLSIFIFLFSLVIGYLTGVSFLVYEMASWDWNSGFKAAGHVIIRRLGVRLDWKTCMHETGSECMACIHLF